VTAIDQTDDAGAMGEQWDQGEGEKFSTLIWLELP
jgi:hypothetical protein